MGPLVCGARGRVPGAVDLAVLKSTIERETQYLTLVIIDAPCWLQATLFTGALVVLDVRFAFTPHTIYAKLSGIIWRFDDATGTIKTISLFLLPQYYITRACVFFGRLLRYYCSFIYEGGVAAIVTFRTVRFRDSLLLYSHIVAVIMWMYIWLLSAASTLAAGKYSCQCNRSELLWSMQW